jgi:hypothetical protein
VQIACAIGGHPVEEVIAGSREDFGCAEASDSATNFLRPPKHLISLLF